MLVVEERKKSVEGRLDLSGSFFLKKKTLESF